MKTYRQEIEDEMTWLAHQPQTIFLGEGIVNAGRIYETLGGVGLKRCVEMPICENLIAGSAVGLSLLGYRPVVVFQRMDFMLIAADAIINHLALMEELSGGKVVCPVIIRSIIGSRNKNFDVGPQHNHDFSVVFYKFITTLEYRSGIYKWAYEQAKPILVVEDRDKYEGNI